MIIKEETTKTNIKIYIQDGADWEYTFRAIDLDSGLYVEITHCRTIVEAEKRYNKYITIKHKPKRGGSNGVGKNRMGVRTQRIDAIIRQTIRSGLSDSVGGRAQMYGLLAG